MTKQISIHWPGHDEILLEYDSKTQRPSRLKVIGCAEIIKKFKALTDCYRDHSLLEWPVPKGSSHSDMLIRELLLKIQGNWEFPFKEERLCQCREVPTIEVDQAILGGAHSIYQVTMATGAASACSSCSVHIDKILEYRLKGI
jgi:bacterioferritin-associated ferredoxin